jgi:pimeloyl-ACP methyl ester carboxylesterase
MATPAAALRQPLLNRPSILISLIGAALLIAAGLFMMGFIGKSPQSARQTDYRAAVGAQEPRKFVSVDEVPLAYTDSGGSGPVIICLHAIGHGARDFEDLSRRLSPDYRVIALDFPGQGNSGSDSQPASGTRYTQLLEGFVDQLDIRSATLLGNSIGGAVAVRYAHTHPDRVDALVLCDSGGLQPVDRAGRFFIGVFVQFFAAGRRGASWYPWAFDKYYRHVLPGDAAHDERARIVRSAYEIAPVLEQAWRSFAKPEENLGPILHEVRCPVMLAWAKDDFVLPLKGAEPALQQFPRHELEVFDGGHAPFLEDPDHFEQALRSFLRASAK